MIDRKQAILADLERARAVLNSVLDKLTPEQWAMPVQEGDAHWTAHQVLSHLFDAERGMISQAVRIAAGEEPIPPDFDLNRWNKRATEKLKDKSVAELRQGLAELSLKLKEELDKLSEAQLDRIGRHSSLQMMSVEQIIQLIGAHEIAHAEGIAAALGLATA